MDHPNVTHWDDVEAEESGAGAVRDLAGAAGAAAAGALELRVAPGATVAPGGAGDAETLVYVLAGEGHAGERPLEAGDALLRLPGEPAPALTAGPGGLTLLAFGPREPWTPAEPAPHAGAMTSVGEVPPSEDHRGKVREKTRRIGQMLGARATGLRHVRVAPDAHGTPHHCHGADEELFVVLGGAGVVRLGDERFAVRRGSVVARPPGTGVAHSFVAGERGLELLTWGTNRPNDIAYYPDSDKVYFRGVGVIGRLEPCGYWDGEE